MIRFHLTNAIVWVLRRLGVPVTQCPSCGRHCHGARTSCPRCGSGNWPPLGSN